MNASFASLSKFRKEALQKVPPPITTMVIPDEALVQILKRCDPVTVGRCAAVCNDWRRIIVEQIVVNQRLDEIQWSKDEMMGAHSSSESQSSTVVHHHNQIRLPSGRARIFVCDRRRVILERYRDEYEMEAEREVLKAQRLSMDEKEKEVPSLYWEGANRKYTYREGPTANPVPNDLIFVDEQWAFAGGDSKESNWAFKFDLRNWIAEYDVQDVAIHNFCSFLDRESTAMAEPAVPTVYQRRLTEATNALGNMHTPPWSGGNSPTHPPGPFPLSDLSPATAFHALPENSELGGTLIVLNTLNRDNIAECKQLSSGRVERLVQQLSQIRPLHLLFKDHDMMGRWGKRPVLIIFYAIHLLRPHLRRLTLDELRAPAPVQLHAVLSLAGIEGLKVHEATKRSAITVTENLLLSWLRLNGEKRKKIKMTFRGCRELNAQSLMKFVRSWQSTEEPCEFESISVDTYTVNPAEFVLEAERKNYAHREIELTTKENWSETLLSRKMYFKHHKGGVCIEYSVQNKSLVLNCLPLSRSSSILSRFLPFNILTPTTRIVEDNSNNEQIKINNMDGVFSLNPFTRTRTIPSLSQRIPVNIDYDINYSARLPLLEKLRDDNRYRTSRLRLCETHSRAWPPLVHRVYTHLLRIQQHSVVLYPFEKDDQCTYNWLMSEDEEDSRDKDTDCDNNNQRKKGTVVVPVMPRSFSNLLS